MSLHRHNPKRDMCEPLIREALDAAGYYVVQLSDPGVPDLLLIRNGRLMLMECKARNGTLTEAQHKWHLCALAHGYQVAVVTTAEQALEAAHERFR